MPSLRATSCADALLPLEYSTTDSACCPCVSALVVLPRVKPACSTLSAIVAASPVTVVPLSTATVIDLGLIAGAVFLLVCLVWDVLLLPPPPLTAAGVPVVELLLLPSCDTPYAAPAPSTRMPTTINAM